MGTDDLHKKNKVRNTRRKRVEQKAVLIALEDTKSSKYYFDALLKDKKLTGQVIFAKHIGTDPCENNPLTMIFELVECLNSLYEKEKRCTCFPLDKL